MNDYTPKWNGYTYRTQVPFTLPAPSTTLALCYAVADRMVDSMTDYPDARAIIEKIKHDIHK